MSWNEEERLDMIQRLNSTVSGFDSNTEQNRNNSNSRRSNYGNSKFDCPFTRRSSRKCWLECGAVGALVLLIFLIILKHNFAVESHPSKHIIVSVNSTSDKEDTSIDRVTTTTELSSSPSQVPTVIENLAAYKITPGSRTTTLSSAPPAEAQDAVAISTKQTNSEKTVPTIRPLPEHPEEISPITLLHQLGLNPNFILVNCRQQHPKIWRYELTFAFTKSVYGGESTRKNAAKTVAASAAVKDLFGITYNNTRTVQVTSCIRT